MSQCLGGAWTMKIGSMLSYTVKPVGRPRTMLSSSRSAAVIVGTTLQSSCPSAFVPLAISFRPADSSHVKIPQRTPSFPDDPSSVETRPICFRSFSVSGYRNIPVAIEKRAWSSSIFQLLSLSDRK